eukprot:CAMPEP_0168740098 /NCGR_PEP_ID=MMETSP0724-20121128/11802_1 /TAXON_ID=265536 /ORGANISM="Amphiprora sp., Strain CCMP467" /LENGTH=366 /DNA_ID=CAMNT_0008787519 /DNA_START=61 /DNA_END=1161 /DNA_ORIENTATION=+
MVRSTRKIMARSTRSSSRRRQEENDNDTTASTTTTRTTTRTASTTAATAHRKKATAKKTTTTTTVTVVKTPKRTLKVKARDKIIRKRALRLFQRPHLLAVKLAAAETATKEPSQPPFQSSMGPDRIELPILYAALQRIQEIGHPAWWRYYQPPPQNDDDDESNNNNNNSSSNNYPRPTTDETDTDLTEDDLQLIRNASLAVPLLMMRKVYDHLVLPRTMGGLAWSDAKAKQVAKTLFATLGPGCCAETITEQELIRHCKKQSQQQQQQQQGNDATTTTTTTVVVLKPQEAHKLLPLLKTVGREARSQVPEISAQLEEGLDDNQEEDDDDGDEEDGNDNVTNEHDKAEDANNVDDEGDDEEDSVLAD